MFVVVVVVVGFVHVSIGSPTWAIKVYVFMHWCSNVEKDKMVIIVIIM